MQTVQFLHKIDSRCDKEVREIEKVPEVRVATEISSGHKKEIVSYFYDGQK